MTRKDAPDYTETEVETYSAEELGQLFGACSAAERLVFQFFLGTGCREREVMFATWKDVDLTAGTFTVKAKPAMGFKPKDSEERTIPIPSSLVRDLKVLKATSKSLLIFPNGQGRPNGHLLSDLKEVVGRARATAFPQRITRAQAAPQPGRCRTRRVWDGDACLSLLCDKLPEKP